ncbi:MAG TPA: diguanylate cyclase, partial [Sphingomonadaceae bacterium]|nr:diguanylate cyclase [Sphingomonadaceae bacterium]
MKEGPDKRDNVPDPERRIGPAERDIVTLGIAAAAIILFVGTGGSVLPQVVRSSLYGGASPDIALTNALLLNIALLIFGWRRYRDLSREIGERRKAEETARLLAETDALTGLLNRRSFAATVNDMIERARETRTELAIVMLDLDNFKQINDVQGHKAGDEVLCETSRKLTELLPVEAALARLGGDEFAIALPFDSRAPEKVDQLAESLVNSLSGPIAFGKARQETSISAGIASTRGEAGKADPAELGQNVLHQADIAMYHAKKQGKNRYSWFEATMESELLFRNDLETGIRRGIEKGEFVPYYEQQIDLGSGDLVGFEMLARWNSPQFGLVNPEIFIPIAEEIDAIGALSEALIRLALKDAREWDPKLTLSVNISP